MEVALGALGGLLLGLLLAPAAARWLLRLQWRGAAPLLMLLGLAVIGLGVFLTPR